MGKDGLPELEDAESLLSRLGYEKYVPNLVPLPIVGAIVYNTSYGLYGWSNNSFVYRFRDGITLITESILILQVKLKGVWYSTVCSKPLIVAKTNRYNLTFSATLNGTFYGIAQIIATYGMFDLPKFDLAFSWNNNSESHRWIWKVRPNLSFSRVAINGDTSPIPVSGQILLENLSKIDLTNITDYKTSREFYIGINWVASRLFSSVSIGIDPDSGFRGLTVTFPEKQDFIDPYVVSLTDGSGATAYNPQKRSFNAQNLEWAFYAQNISGSYSGVYSSSSDNGVSWSSPTIFRSISAQALEFSVASNYTHMAYVYSRGTTYGDDLYYRLGKLWPNGSITWIDSEKTVYNCSSILNEIREKITRTGIIFDSNGNNWIYCSWFEYYQPLYAQWVFKNDNTDGTWSMSHPNHPYEIQVGTTDVFYPYHILVPLTGGKTYDVYPWYRSAHIEYYLNGTKWGGSSWTKDDDICPNEKLSNGGSGIGLFSISSYQDNIYLVFNRKVLTTSYSVRHKNYSGSSWETNSRTVYTPINSTSSPCISVNDLNASAYCFWIGNYTSSGSNVVMYKKWTSSSNSWDANPTQFSVETTIQIMQSLTCAWNHNYTIGVIYTNGSSPNYWVKWQNLTFQYPAWTIISTYSFFLNIPIWNLVSRVSDNLVLSLWNLISKASDNLLVASWNLISQVSGNLIASVSEVWNLIASASHFLNVGSWNHIALFSALFNVAGWNLIGQVWALLVPPIGAIVKAWLIMGALFLGAIFIGIVAYTQRRKFLK